MKYISLNWTLALKFSIGKKKRMRDCRILMAHDCSYNVTFRQVYSAKCTEDPFGYQACGTEPSQEQKFGQHFLCDQFVCQYKGIPYSGKYYNLYYSCNGKPDCWGNIDEVGCANIGDDFIRCNHTNTTISTEQVGSAELS